jgi:hypothetical protein
MVPRRPARQRAQGVRPGQILQYDEQVRLLRQVGQSPQHGLAENEWRLLRRVPANRPPMRQDQPEGAQVKAPTAAPWRRHSARRSEQCVTPHQQRHGRVLCRGTLAARTPE